MADAKARLRQQERDAAKAIADKKAEKEAKEKLAKEKQAANIQAAMKVAAKVGKSFASSVYKQVLPRPHHTFTQI